MISAAIIPRKAALYHVLMIFRLFAELLSCIRSIVLLPPSSKHFREQKGHSDGLGCFLESLSAEKVKSVI